MDERDSKIKQHFKDNKKVYAIGSMCLVVGVVAGYLSRSKSIQIVDNFNLKYKSPTSNTVVTQLVRRGHPGNLILCKESGEVFASQNRAANVLGINSGEISKNVRGLTDKAGDFTFEKIGEAS